MNFNQLTPKNLPEYTLIDSGGGEKLEQFGKYILRRPEPQAVWSKTLDESDWEKQAHAVFNRKGEKDSENGHWRVKPGMPDRWIVEYKTEKLKLKFRLALTSFKHVGIFPEQAENWDFIYDAVKNTGIANPKVLNLFAYTGGASLAARAAGADVTHVDSVKQVLTWSRENMESSSLDGIRWVLEDAFKFVQREVKRGNNYQGIILDPPAYGRGPDGEKWYLDQQIDEMLFQCNALLQKTNSFFLINLYSMGFSTLITENLVRNNFKISDYHTGEIYLQDKALNKLPLGTFLRFERP